MIFFQIGKVLILFLFIHVIHLPLTAIVDHQVLINHELLNELQLMCQKDQEARFKMINSENFDEEVIKVDHEHLPALKVIVDKFGWPGFQLVGEEGAECMWLLIQHCDEDVEFQKQCLLLLEEAVGKKDVPKRHLAYLKDRVLVNAGKDQIYGTQLQIINGRARLSPVEDPQNLDKRREEMDLCSIDEYFSLIREVYHLKRTENDVINSF